MRRARVKVAPNLGRKLGRTAAPAPAKAAEDAANKSLSSPAAKTTTEAEKPSTPTAGSSVKESLRLGIEQRSRRDSTTGSQTKDVVSPPPTPTVLDNDSNKMKSPPPLLKVSESDSAATGKVMATDTAFTANSSPQSQLKSSTPVSSDSVVKAKENNEGDTDKPDTAKATSVKPSELPKPAIGRRSRFMKAKPNIVESSRNRARLNSVSDSESNKAKSRLNSISDSDTETSKRLIVASPKPVPLVPVPTTSKEPSKEPSETSEILQEKPLQETNDVPKVKEVKKVSGSQEKKGEKKTRRRTKKEILDGPDYKRQQRRHVTLYEPIDRAKLTIRDLIYMNPSSNPMKLSEKDKQQEKEKDKPEEKEKDEDKTKEKDQAAEIPENEETADNTKKQPDEVNANEATVINDDEEEDEAMPVPQVTIGADGQIILNEQSLVIANPKDKENIRDMEIVQESESSGKWGYGKSYTCRTWTLNETKKFYLALSTVGTDFTLMAKVFPSRSRLELKRKFKREEQVNRFLIDEAVKERMKFDQDFMDELIALDLADTEERERKAKEKEEKKQRKKERAENGADVKPKASTEKKPRKPRKRKRDKFVEDDDDDDDVKQDEKDEVQEEEEAAEEETKDVKKIKTEKTQKKTQVTKAKRKARGVRGKKARSKKAKLMYDVSDDDDTEDPDLLLDIVPEPNEEVEVAEQSNNDSGDTEMQEDTSEPFIPRPPEDAPQGTEVHQFLNRLHGKPTRSGRVVRTPKSLLPETESDDEEEIGMKKIKHSKKMVIESDDDYLVIDESEAEERTAVKAKKSPRKGKAKAKSAGIKERTTVQQNQKTAISNSSEKNDSCEEGTTGTRDEDVVEHGSASASDKGDSVHVSGEIKDSGALVSDANVNGGQSDASGILQSPISTKADIQSPNDTEKCDVPGASSDGAVSFIEELVTCVNESSRKHSEGEVAKTKPSDSADGEENRGCIFVEVLDAEDDETKDDIHRDTRDSSKTDTDTVPNSGGLGNVKTALDKEGVVNKAQNTEVNTQSSSSTQSNIGESGAGTSGAKSSHSLQNASTAYVHRDKTGIAANEGVCSSENDAAVTSIDLTGEKVNMDIEDESITQQEEIKNESDKSKIGENDGVNEEKKISSHDVCDNKNIDKDLKENKDVKSSQNDTDDTSNDDDDNDDSIVVVGTEGPSECSRDQTNTTDNSSSAAGESSASAAKAFEPGSLVFVTSDPTVDENGVEVPGAIHVYLVPESGDFDNNAVNLGSMPGNAGGSSEDLARLLQQASAGILGQSTGDPSSSEANTTQQNDSVNNSTIDKCDS